MVYKRSEYGQQFKVTSLVKNVPVYKENVNYRHQRRELECAHTPISWDWELTESEDSDEKLSPDAEVDKLPVKDIQIIEEEKEEDAALSDTDSVDKEKKAAQREDENQQEKQGTDKDEVEITQQNEQLRKAARMKLKQYVSVENRDDGVAKEKQEMPIKKSNMSKTFVKPKKTTEEAFKKRIRPKRPDRLQEIPKARPSTAPAERPDSREDMRAPFVAYGCGGQEKSLGEKKTFNIRASSAVYPAALRARKRNMLIIEKLREKQKNATAREKRKQALFNARLSRETASWDTEYRRSYSAYEDTEYSTNDREPRKMKSYFLK